MAEIQVSSFKSRRISVIWFFRCHQNDNAFESEMAVARNEKRRSIVLWFPFVDAAFRSVPSANVGLYVRFVVKTCSQASQNIITRRHRGFSHSPKRLSFILRTRNTRDTFKQRVPPTYWRFEKLNNTHLVSFQT